MQEQFRQLDGVQVHSAHQGGGDTVPTLPEVHSSAPRKSPLPTHIIGATQLATGPPPEQGAIGSKMGAVWAVRPTAPRRIAALALQAALAFPARIARNAYAGLHRVQILPHPCSPLGPADAGFGKGKRAAKAHMTFNKMWVLPRNVTRPYKNRTPKKIQLAKRRRGKGLRKPEARAWNGREPGYSVS
jgi:hypothetical protein